MHIALQLAYSRSASIGRVKLTEEDLHAGYFGQCGQRFGVKPISSRLRTCILDAIDLYVLH
jgi:hypothetical protein